jgi:hypothetical protein
MSQVNIDGICGRPVAECTAAQITDSLTRSFEGYVVSGEYSNSEDGTNG